MFAKVDGWLARFIPGQCVLCGLASRQARLCDGCRADMPWIWPGCEHCSAPLPRGSAPGRCAGCDLVMVAVDRVRAAVVYERPVDHLVTAAKFTGRLDCAHALGELLACQLQREAQATRCELVIPVPLHPARLARRGYNQAAVVGAAAARAVGLPFKARLCRRRVSTSAQSGLARGARRANVRDAFVGSDALAGVKLAIVDDVVTTGHTLSALACALREAGVAHVEAWCAARVVSGQGPRKM